MDSDHRREPSMISSTLLCFWKLLILVTPVIVVGQETNYFPPPSNSDLNLVALNNTLDQPAIKISSVLDLRNQIVISFRSCHSGILLHQQGQNGDEFQVGLVNASLEISWKYNSEDVRESGMLSVGSDLTNNQWNTVEFAFYLGVITVTVEEGGEVIHSATLSNSTLRRYLWDLQLGGPNNPLEIGSGFTGCLQEGPNVMFSIGEVYALPGVIWGSCSMAENIAGCNVLPNPCWLYPCMNGGTCNMREDGGYLCQCPSPYSGTNCENDLGFQGCNSSPCMNGGTCDPQQNATRRYQCICPDGYKGVNCEINVNECLSQPCRRGQCIDLVNDYMCNCTDTGYSGTACDEDINECTASPCSSGSSCVNLFGTYKCQCPPGQGGRHCEIDIDECESAPCQHGGTCQDSSDRFICECAAGWTGDMCQLSVDDCVGIVCDDSVPHTYCVDGHMTYTCQCRPGYIDERAAPDTNATQCVEVDPCAEHRCANEAVCVADESNGERGYTCSCSDSYTGVYCDVEIVDPCQTHACTGNTQCVSNAGVASCECVAGYTGQDCLVNIDDCLGVICLNEGQCRDLVNGYECQCVDGWGGALCDDMINLCLGRPCRHGATCNPTDNYVHYTCTCQPGFTGEICETDIQECDSSPCQNGGTCIDNVNSFTCSCLPDWTGVFCEQEYNVCMSDPCKNGATCIASTEPGVYSYECVCVSGYMGTHCATNIDDCVDHSCEPYQECYDGINTYTCDCPIGFTGDDCSEEIDECASSPCQHGGTCHDGVGNYTCDCVQTLLDTSDAQGHELSSFIEGYKGSNCEQAIDMCAYADPPVCQHNAQCVANGTDFTCFCGSNDGQFFAGRYCEYSDDYCGIAVVENPPPCHNGATCISSRNNYQCVCPEGFTGERCMVNIDDCVGNQCMNGAACEDGIAEYTCTCTDGYTGIYCEEDIDECESLPCQHDSQCVDGVNSFTCNCTNTGYEGELCNIEVLECTSSPCMHGGSCVEHVNGYTCTCHSGYTGRNCETDIDECLSSPCQHSGTCTQISTDTLVPHNQAHGYTCTCRPGYNGANCEVNIDECASSPCVHGSCTDLTNGYQCSCALGYDGVQCDIEINECSVYAPCQHDAHCTDLIADYHCDCPVYSSVQPLLYGGKNCSVALTICDSGVSRCQNDGRCLPFLVDEANDRQDYTCSCTAGFSGQHCEVIRSAAFQAASNEPKYAALSVNVAAHNDNDVVLDLWLAFRTTLPNVLLFEAYDAGSNYVYCNLQAGQQVICSYHFQSSVILSVPFEPHNSGDESVSVEPWLNDGEWHSIHVRIADNRFNVTVAHNTYSTTHRQSYTEDHSIDTFAIQALVIGAANADRGVEDYTGCMQDILVNNVDIVPHEARMTNQPVTPETCTRDIQCTQETCNQHGACTDLWVSHQCHCYRPYYGTNCEHNIIAATFGHQRSTNSIATYEIPANQQQAFSENIDLSMFIRTRQSNSFLLYVGSADLSNNNNEQQSPTYSLVAEIVEGSVRVSIQSASTGDVLSVSSGERKVDTAIQHLIHVQYTVEGGLVLRVDSHTYTASVPPEGIATIEGGVTAEVLHLGRVPDSGGGGDERRKRQAEGPSMPSFSGTMQDIRLNGQLLQFFPSPGADEHFDDPVLMMSSSDNLAEGEQTDDVCTLDEPCQNGSVCDNVFYNDYRCNCTSGFRGKNCSETDYCYTVQCPEQATCNSLHIGYECLSPATFSGDSSSTSLLHYMYTGTNTPTLHAISLRMRSRRTNSIVLFLENGVDQYAYLHVTTNGHLSLIYNWAGNSGSISVMDTDITDAQWHDVHVDVPFTDTLIESNLRVYVGGLPNGVRLPNLVADVQRYKGCLDNVRLGALLLPAYTDDEMPNNIAVDRFVLSAPSHPGCHSDPVCDSDDCENGATCHDIWNDYTCECIEGYNGTLCDHNIDDCLHNECIHGDCLDGVNMYTCVCHPGYTSPLCDMDIKECDSEPCQNNATCMEGVDRYTCNCLANYTGSHCEVEITATCEDEPCQNQATCVPVQTAVPGIEQYSCNCLPGYEGSLCERLIDYCEGDPCQHDSNCTVVSHLETYECTCTDGYEGRNCSVDIQECASNPCQHNSECIDLVNSYTCDCASGWDGVLCSEDIDECENVTLCGLGTCINYDGGYQCDCSNTGYNGEHCELQINECEASPSPCQHNSTCSDTDGSYDCSCTLGYSGLHCETANCSATSGSDEQSLCLNEATCYVTTDASAIAGATDWNCRCLQYYTGSRCETRGPCVDLPCMNDGVCNQQGDEYNCTCITGWEGDNCQDDIDECLITDQCMHGGTCMNTQGSYTCACIDGYTSSRCEVNIQECDSSPCAHDGVCVDAVNHFTCDCSLTGFTGELCADDIDECNTLESPCHNHGTCNNTIGSYACTCDGGYTGSYCQLADPCGMTTTSSETNENVVDACNGNGECRYNLLRDEELVEKLEVVCECYDEWIGENCTEPNPLRKKVEDDDDQTMIIIIVVVVAAVVLIIIIAVVAFLLMAKSKRATRGTYSPSTQEQVGSRLEMGHTLKIPPEERLI